MRDPSIHIKRSDLIKILEGYLSKNVIDKVIFPRAKRYACDNRIVTISNEKVNRDIKRKLTSSKGDTYLLSEIVYSVRIKLKHRGVGKVTEADRDWLQLKELTKLVNQFCEEFNLPKRAGYIKYIEIAFSKITTMRAYLSKFISMYQVITAEYDATLELKSVSNPTELKEAHDYFVRKISDRTGISNNFLNRPDKMVAFSRMSKLCDELNVDTETFIDAQFDALEWCSGIPTPEQLYGDKAIERLNSYLFENKISVGKSESKKQLWSSIKKR